MTPLNEFSDSATDIESLITLPKQTLFRYQKIYKQPLITNIVHTRIERKMNQKFIKRSPIIYIFNEEY